MAGRPIGSSCGQEPGGVGGVCVGSVHPFNPGATIATLSFMMIPTSCQRGNTKNLDGTTDHSLPDCRGPRRPCPMKGAGGTECLNLVDHFP